MTTKKIFISYSRVDGGDFALRISHDLKEKGYDVWLDQEDIRAGAEWDLEIENALKASDCVLFIETEKSVNSNNVLDEVYYALELHKQVIPLIFVDAKTPFRLQRIQHIDFSKDYASGLVHLVNELTKTNEVRAVGPDEIQTSKTTSKPFFAQYAKPITITASLLVIICAVIFFVAYPKANLPRNKNTDTVDVKALSGDWQMFDVDPKVKSSGGYLKIADVDGKNVTIKSYVQFYYITTNDTSFLSVFNAFAGCSSCILTKQTKLTVEDVSIGSRTISTLKKQSEDGKPGDTLMDAGSTKSIRAYATLQILNNKNIVIEVKQPVATALANNLVLQPFTYLFRFKKSE